MLIENVFRCAHEIDSKYEQRIEQHIGAHREIKKRPNQKMREKSKCQKNENDPK